MFRSFCFLSVLFCTFSLHATHSFPWKTKQFEVDPKKGYELQFNTKTVRFFKESIWRNEAGAALKIQNPYIDISMDYTYNIYEKHHYFRPYELALKLKRSDGSWMLGRKNIEWSEEDLFWNRNLWQPIYSDDTLRPKTAGLTGLFRHFEYKGGSTTVFGSLVYIPEFTPYFENRDGNLTSKNPWFTPPPSDKLKPTNILPYYTVHRPGLKDFVKPSVAVHTYYKGFYLAYAYKPVNKIKIKSPAILDLSQPLVGNSEQGFRVNIPVESVLLQHHIVNGGLTFGAPNREAAQSIDYRLKASFSYNRPEVYALENDSYIFFQPITEWYVSGRGEMHVTDALEKTILHLAYTHHIPINSSKIGIAKTLPEIEKQFFKGDLFKFSTAASAGISHSVQFNDGQSADIKGRLIYHLLREYFLFSFYTSFTLDSNISFFISGDVLFSNFPFSIDQTQRDIGIYKNKSRTFGGLKYVF